MQLQVLLFGIVSDLIGKNEVSFSFSGTTVADFKKELTSSYPKLQNYKSYVIAINESYANDNQVLLHADVVAIIPPVSGG